MKLILATPGLSPKERKTASYHLNRFLPQLKRKLGRHNKGTLILRALLSKNGTPEVPTYHLTLSVRLPEHPVVVQKDGRDIGDIAFEAEKSMKRELRGSVAKVRKDYLRRKRAAEKEAFRSFSEQMAPHPAARNGHARHPETSPVFARLRPLLASLYNHAREEIQAAEAAGEIAQGYLSPEDLVDHAIVAAIEGGAEALRDPEALEFRLYRHMHAALEAEVARENPMEMRQVSLEDAAPEDARWTVADPEAEEREFFQPFEALRMADVLVDDHAEDPEAALSDHEQHRLILKRLAGFHKKARSAFFLNRVEGFEPYEIAMIQNRSEADVVRDVAECVSALREALRSPTLFEVRHRPAAITTATQGA